MNIHTSYVCVSLPPPLNKNIAYIFPYHINLQRVIHYKSHYKYSKNQPTHIQ